MSIDVAGYMFAVIAIGISFVAARSSYWILKFIAGLCWLIMAFFWIAYAPASVAKGSPADTVIVLMLFFASIAFMFFMFWTPKAGKENSGRFRFPFTPSEEEEEEERQRSYMPSRAERNANYRNRVGSALRGKRRRRY